MTRITISTEADDDGTETYLVEDSSDLCDPISGLLDEAAAYAEAEAMANDVEDATGTRPQIIKL